MGTTVDELTNMSANPAEIKQQVLDLIEQVPPAADWLGLLHDVELATDRASGLLDPNSPLRQALNRALAESDAGLGIDHDTIRSRFLTQ